MTENYQNILVALDGSSESELAFQRALTIAQKNNSNIYLVNIIDLRSFVGLEAYDKSLPERAKEVMEEMLKEYQIKATSLGLEKVTIVVEFGDPKKLIPNDIAHNLDIDLIISGATGLSSVEKFFTGSVSESIMRRAKCDVLIARGKKEQ